MQSSSSVNALPAEDIWVGIIFPFLFQKDRQALRQTSSTLRLYLQHFYADQYLAESKWETLPLPLRALDEHSAFTDEERNQNKSRGSFLFLANHPPKDFFSFSGFFCVVSVAELVSAIEERVSDVGLSMTTTTDNDGNSIDLVLAPYELMMGIAHSFVRQKVRPVRKIERGSSAGRQCNATGDEEGNLAQEHLSNNTRGEDSNWSILTTVEEALSVEQLRDRVYLGIPRRQEEDADDAVLANVCHLFSDREPLGINLLDPLFFVDDEDVEEEKMVKEQSVPPPPPPFQFSKLAWLFKTDGYVVYAVKSLVDQLQSLPLKKDGKSTPSSLESSSSSDSSSEDVAPKRKRKKKIQQETKPGAQTEMLTANPSSEIQEGEGKGKIEKGNFPSPVFPQWYHQLERVFALCSDTLPASQLQWNISGQLTIPRVKSNNDMARHEIPSCVSFVLFHHHCDEIRNCYGKRGGSGQAKRKLPSKLRYVRSTAAKETPSIGEVFDNDDRKDELEIIFVHEDPSLQQEKDILDMENLQSVCLRSLPLRKDGLLHCFSKQSFQCLKKLELLGTMLLVDTIPANSFSQFSVLEYLNISGLTGLKKIENKFCYYCQNLRQLVLPTLNKIDTIGDGFCSHAVNLTEVNTGSCFNLHLTIISVSFFTYCRSLPCIDLHRCHRLQQIGADFCYECNALTTIYFPNISAVAGGVGGAIRDISPHFLEYCTSLTELKNFNFFNNVGKIDSHFCRHCESLLTIDLSRWNQLQEIEGYFLSDCANLRYIHWPTKNNVNRIGSHFLGYCTSLKAPVDLSSFKRKLVSIGDNFLTESLQDVISFAGLENLSETPVYFLSYCRKLIRIESMESLKNLKKIGANFLHYCCNLPSVDFKALINVEEVGLNFLAHTTTLKSLEVPVFQGSTTCPKITTQVIAIKGQHCAVCQYVAVEGNNQNADKEERRDQKDGEQTPSQEDTD